jgi:hypothetical protein
MPPRSRRCWSDDGGAGRSTSLLPALLALVVASAAVLTGWQGLAGQDDPSVQHITDQGIPMTVHRPAGRCDRRVAAVVLVHGLAGSQQVMGGYAVGLVRAASRW